jgi:hypothetical protein
MMFCKIQRVAILAQISISQALAFAKPAQRAIAKVFFPFSVTLAMALPLKICPLVALPFALVAMSYGVSNQQKMGASVVFVAALSWASCFNMSRADKAWFKGWFQHVNKRLQLFFFLSFLLTSALALISMLSGFEFLETMMASASDFMLVEVGREMY